MALNVTQCPSCESTFNTSARMLDAAHGLVRCGACLSVFEANENFIGALAPASNDETDVTENESVFISGQEDYFDPTSFLERSELLAEEGADPIDEARIDPIDGERIDPIDEARIDPIDEARIDPADEEESEQIDEEAPAKESENHSSLGIEASTEYQFEETFIELPEFVEEGGPTSAGSDGDIETDVDSQLLEYSLINSDSSLDDSEDVQVIALGDADFDIDTEDQSSDDVADNELETDEQTSLASDESSSVADVQASYDNAQKTTFDDLTFIKNKSLPADTSSVEESRSEDTPDISEFDEPQKVETTGKLTETSDDELQPQEETESKDKILARLSTSALEDADPELESLSDANLAAIVSMDQSLELEQAQPAKRILRTLLWSGAGVFLVSMLAAQFFWQRMAMLSLDTRFRPGYEIVCRFTGCELPPMQDLANIQTENMVIRSHPEIANSLELTAVFRNVASFQQPFPVIELSFSNINSQPIASREFTPEEYLPEALRTIRNMPVGAPVQITLEFIDPGEAAVNYSLDFRPLPIRQ